VVTSGQAAGLVPIGQEPDFSEEQFQELMALQNVYPAHSDVVGTGLKEVSRFEEIEHRENVRFAYRPPLKGCE
jgi:hypothetical protein